MLTSRQMLEMATLNGAQVAGVGDRAGSLTPGKQADVVVLDATALNVAPVIDPVAAVTNCADVSNVEMVLIGGQVRKRDGKLVADAGGARRLVEASRDHLMGELERKRAEQPPA
jgi:cytosine/adenosine deaminase-related metal-dependent hydrolase